MSFQAGPEIAAYPTPEICADPYGYFATLRGSGRVHKVPGRGEYLVSWFDVGNIVAEVVNFINGGMHTTGDMLGNTMRLLLDHGDERLWEDRGLLGKAIEESLRLEPTLQWTGRLALRDAEVAGTVIPAGSVLLLLLASANRDATVFEAPDSFEPRRSDLKAHLAFGTHIHSCLGAPLARLEGRVAFERLFARLRNIRLAPENDFAARDSLNFRGPRVLLLEFDC